MTNSLPFGIASKQMDAIVAKLNKYQSIDKAVIFGSRAKGNYKPGSDIDIALFGDLKLKEMHQLNIDLDDLMLPYTFDLIIYSKIINNDLLEHIHRVGKIVFEKTKNG